MFINGFLSHLFLRVRLREKKATSAIFVFSLFFWYERKLPIQLNINKITSSRDSATIFSRRTEWVYTPPSWSLSLYHRRRSQMGMGKKWEQNNQREKEKKANVQSKICLDLLMEAFGGYFVCRLFVILIHILFILFLWILFFCLYLVPNNLRHFYLPFNFVLYGTTTNRTSRWQMIANKWLGKNDNVTVNCSSLFIYLALNVFFFLFNVVFFFRVP